MNYYEKLNKAIKNTLEDRHFSDQLHYFDEVVLLAKIIIENTPSLVKEEYSSFVPLDTSLAIVGDFFHGIKKEYATEFQALLQEKSDENSVSFHKIEKNEKDCSLVNDKGEVKIDYTKMLNDSFTIAHEMTHKFSQEKNHHSIIKQFLGEMPTITMEFLLEDYLLEHTDYKEEEIRIRKKNRLLETYDDAGAVLLENTLLKLYQQNNGQITQDVLLHYLDSMDKNSKLYELFSTRGEHYLNEIVENGTLLFAKRERYVIGTLCASCFHQKMKNQEANGEELSYIMAVLGHSDNTTEEDLKALSKLDIPLLKNGQVDLSEETRLQLASAYQKEREEFSLSKKTFK